jgi:hypothetical protein
MTQKTNQNPWSMDVRVRERNLKSGVLTEKDVEKHLAALPDVAEQAEPFSHGQPALAQAAHHAPAVSTAAAAAPDEGDDEDDDNEDEEPAATGDEAP